MIAALLLGLAAVPQAAPTATPTDDVVVTARRLQRLRRLRVVTRKDRRTGIFGCVVKRPSGDPRLDAEVCAIAAECAAKVRSEAEIVPCVKPTLDALVPRTAWTATRTRD